jgi:hypothetical protein
VQKLKRGAEVPERRKINLFLRVRRTLAVLRLVDNQVSDVSSEVRVRFEVSKEGSRRYRRIKRDLGPYERLADWSPRLADVGDDATGEAAGVVVAATSSECGSDGEDELEGERLDAAYGGQDAVEDVRWTRLCRLR